MANALAKPILHQIALAEAKFKKANDFQLVSWQREAGFARQAIQNSDKLQKCEPQTIQDALINVAATGLSLNPATKYAYLVPRKGKCCLDISYMGLIKLAIDAGAIVYAKAELVYASDEFEYRGPTEKPVHRADPFAPPDERGQVRGVYCIAKLPSGDYLVETMSKAQIDEVKGVSKAKSGPWVEWYGEMAKKTVIKRASKTWPKTERSIVLERAIATLNDHEGFEEEPTHSGKVLVNDEQLAVLETQIADYEIDKSKIVRALGVDEIGHLPADQFERAKSLIKRAAKAAA